MKRRRLACDRPVVARDGRTTAQSRGASTGSMTRRRRLLKAGGGIAVVCTIFVLLRRGGACGATRGGTTAMACRFEHAASRVHDEPGSPSARG
jgi:hypothetical protein